ncbi:choice-of-anchor P family protein [Streptomyces chiangmaiensis]|uniref:Choice-of-anchor P family protein n=1 Tax=Streptomyces chiangmaiensis TaxID=766497 RepID=A0ABU7FRJ4_9ACTN|nr:choice-of-anchor P family protein [Streptomyces chiangmaiensis]MED7826707.1 choice-of-anchor P family protein [Streptomyces chiangmaiensis]
MVAAATPTTLGDDVYLPSSDSARLRLQYFTGRAFGIAGHTGGPISVRIPAQPDTGPVRTAHVTSVRPGCSPSAQAPLLSAGTLCPTVTTTLAPGVIASVSRVREVRIGAAGLPVIQVRGSTATAMSRCATTRGTADVDLGIGGDRVAVPTAPNSTIRIPGGGRMVINEQRRTDGGDGIEVTGMRVSLPGNLAGIVLASARSAIHNCAPR